MAAHKINMKKISEDLKNFLTKDMENNTKKITEKVIATNPWELMDPWTKNDSDK